MNDPKTLPNFSLLLVDDDDVAAESVIRSLTRQGISCETVIACDGLEALEILRRQHDTKRVASNCIILLDLNMPRLDGFGFLEALRADPDLKRSVVFVLTTSSRDSDRIRAYNENVAGYMVKSAVGPQFALLAGFLEKYAASVVLP